jgi:hypothetical protein
MVAIAIAVFIGLAVLSPWAAVAALVGLCAGIFVLRFVGKTEPGNASSRPIKGWQITLLFLGAIVFGALLLSTTAAFVVRSAGQGQIDPLLKTAPAVYRGTLAFSHNQLVLRERYLLDPATYQPSVAGVKFELPDSAGGRWVAVSQSGDSTVVEHVPVTAVDVRFRRLQARKTFSVPIRWIRLQSAVVVPKSGSEVTIDAPTRLVVRTDPPSDAQVVPGQEGEHERRVVTLASSEFEAANAIQVETNTRWARNPAAEKVLGFTRWTPAVLVIGAVTAMLSKKADSLVGFVLAAISRLFRGSPPDKPARAHRRKRRRKR